LSEGDAVADVTVVGASDEASSRRTGVDVVDDVGKERQRRRRRTTANDDDANWGTEERKKTRTRQAIAMAS